MESIGGQAANVQNCTALAHDRTASTATLKAAGSIFVAGGKIDLAKVNNIHDGLDGARTRVLVDLPNHS